MHRRLLAIWLALATVAAPAEGQRPVASPRGGGSAARSRDRAGYAVSFVVYPRRTE